MKWKSENSLININGEPNQCTERVNADIFWLGLFVFGYLFKFYVNNISPFYLPGWMT